MSEPLRIRCRENGPLVIHGPFQLVDHQGNAFTLPTDKEHVALCRCGHSANKPFCDGSHRQCGFQAAELAGDDGMTG
jgi:CDGSH-type Zn-finger protein